jgi:hypothetical protein
METETTTEPNQISAPGRKELADRLRDEMTRKHLDPRTATGRLILAWADEAYLAGYNAAADAAVPEMTAMAEHLTYTMRRLRDAQERIEQMTDRACLSPRPPIAPLLRMSEQTRVAS